MSFQVAAAAPRTRPNGRKIPLLVSTTSLEPAMNAREPQPTSNGSKAPSKRGGGKLRGRQPAT